MIYDATQSNEFFVTVGGGAAALTGLVFVAMSLNVESITQDATHQFRAIGAHRVPWHLCRCALVLMGGQNRQAIGVEWIVVALLAGAVYLGGYVQAIRLGGTERARRLDRVIAGVGLYVGSSWELRC